MQLVNVNCIKVVHLHMILQENEKEHLLQLVKKLPVSVQMQSESGHYDHICIN